MFEPKGEKAEWTLLYEPLSQLKVNDTISYEDLSRFLGRPLDENRTPLYRADKELQMRNHKALDNVRGIGYRIAEAREHEGLARRRHKRARRQLGKGLRLLKATDRSALTPVEQKRFMDLEERFSRLDQHFKELDKRTQRTDRRLDEHVERSEDMETKVDKLVKALEKRGINIE